MPVFNGEKYIAAALESIRAQTRPVEEVIVIDDGSTDGTVAIVESFQEVTLLRQANGGPAAARNLGLAQARGDYVAFLDADDMWPPGRQEIVAGILDSDPSVGLVMGTQRLFVEPGAALPEWVPEGDAEAIDPQKLPRGGPGGCIVRRSALEVVGPFDESMLHSEDTDWFLRSRDLGVVWALIPDVVLVRRIHGTNLTYDTEAQRRSMFEVLQRRAARRRAT